MIKFIPKKVPETFNMTDIERLATNHVNNAAAKQMQSKFGDKFCESHPEFVNEILVHGYEKDSTITVKEICCKNFRTTLQLPD
jgi:hypothetical protein